MSSSQGLVLNRVIRKYLYHTFLIFLTPFLSAPYNQSPSPSLKYATFLFAFPFRSGLRSAPPAGNMSGAPLFTRLSLPEGLEEVVEGLAREVIRSQVSEPFDIYNFAWKHFSDLVSRKKDLPAKGEYPPSASLREHTHAHIPISICMYVCLYLPTYISIYT